MGGKNSPKLLKDLSTQIIQPTCKTTWTTVKEAAVAKPAKLSEGPASPAVTQKLEQDSPHGSGLMRPHFQVHSQIPKTMICVFPTFAAILPCILLLKWKLRNEQIQSLTTTRPAAASPAPSR